MKKKTEKAQEHDVPTISDTAPIKLKKILIKKREIFDQNKEYLIKNKLEFDWISSGSVDRIIYKNKEFISVDMSNSGGKGHHLNKMFITDIDAYIAEKGDAIVDMGNNYTEQMFNLEAIEKNLNRSLVSIDITSCYWRTAYKLGYITYETYIIGMRKRDWKVGRNACIGGLCKTVTVMPYKDGKPYKNGRYVVRKPLAYQKIRNHIISHVFAMFEYLFSQMGNTFFMFLTDCLVTTPNKARWVEKYFLDEGYRTKSKSIEFTSVDRTKRKVSWYDFEGTKKDTHGKVIQTGVDRYYLYSNAQVVISTAIDTSGYFVAKPEKDNDGLIEK